MSKILMITFAALLGLSACNTVAGMGEDVSAGGDAVSDTAEDAQGSM